MPTILEFRSKTDQLIGHDNFAARKKRNNDEEEDEAKI